MRSLVRSCVAPPALFCFAIPTHGFAVGYPGVAPNGARSVEEEVELYLSG